jgi:hypothetical protein
MLDFIYTRKCRGKNLFCERSHAPRNDISLNDGPHIRR